MEASSVAMSARGHPLFGSKFALRRSRSAATAINRLLATPVYFTRLLRSLCLTHLRMFFRQKA
jgi:hypothetical protein